MEELLYTQAGSNLSHELQTERYELWAKRGYFLMEVSIAVLGHNSRPPTKILTVTLVPTVYRKRATPVWKPDFPRQFVGHEAHLQRRTRFECLCD